MSDFQSRVSSLFKVVRLSCNSRKPTSCILAVFSSHTHAENVQPTNSLTPSPCALVLAIYKRQTSASQSGRLNIIIYTIYNYIIIILGPEDVLPVFPCQVQDNNTSPLVRDAAACRREGPLCETTCWTENLTTSC